MAVKKKTGGKDPQHLVNFVATQKSPVLEIHQGEYRRRFEAKDQPFSVANTEELQLLTNTGFFVESAAASVKTEKKAEDKAAEKAEAANSAETQG